MLGCAESLNRVRLFATPWPVARQPPLSMRSLQARVLEWAAMPSSRGSPRPRDQTQVSALQVDSLLSEPPGKPKKPGAGSLSLLQGNLPTQESNRGLLHCRQILYQMRSPFFHSTYFFLAKIKEQPLLKRKRKAALAMMRKGRGGKDDCDFGQHRASQNRFLNASNLHVGVRFFIPHEHKFREA